MILNWQNENELRAYPLKSNQSVALNNDVIIDAQMVVSNGAPWTLDSITIADGNITVSTPSQSFITTWSSDPADYPKYVRIPDGSLIVLGKGCAELSGSLTFSNVFFEDGVCLNYGGNWFGVSNISFSAIDTAGVLSGDAVSLSGEIQLQEGYQTNILISQNAIAIDAGSLWGVPIGCGQPDYMVDDCSSIISYINGVSTPDGALVFEEGINFAIYPDPENHAIYLGLPYNSTDICKYIPVTSPII